MTAIRWATALLGVGVLAAAAEAVDQAKVNAAIAAGGAFLKQKYTQPGAAGPAGAIGDHSYGIAALSGMAMIEAGVRKDDPALLNVLQYVRSRALSETKTYHVALAILFLDRYGDPADVPVVQLLGVRLLNGLSPHGGWEYDCGMAIGGQEETRLRAAIQANPRATGTAPPPQAQTPKSGNGFPQPKPGEKKESEPNTAKMHPEVAKYFAAVRTGQFPKPQAGGDNSNTQFGLIGLWVAARHGVPADSAFARIEARFLTSQNPADAGWNYSGAAGSGSTAAMTCAGLLGLAVGAGRGKRAAEGPPKHDPKEGRGPKSDDPFYNAPGKKDDKEGPDLSGLPGTIVPGMGAAHRKKAIEAGLSAIGRVIAATPGGQGLTNYTGFGDQFYTLWSVERVAVGYGLEEIGKANWYEWGCGILLPSQGQTGAWSGKEGEDVSTSFAVLFLSKSNYVADLTRHINQQFKGTELRAGGNKDLFAPQNPHGSAGPQGAAGKPAPAPVVLAPVDPPAPAPSGAEKVAEALVAASKTPGWDAKLTEAKDTKGPEQTAGLVKAIPQLDAEKQKQAREALAERLTRMTANTLRTQMKDSDPELRRAAVLAAAMKEDKSHVPDLINRIADPADVVVRAARAGLRSLTGKDFGPQPGADDAAKAKAKADWDRWYLTEGK